eukprot:COSAG05_NODE_93_length_19581_cov_53.686685_21_plen_598_part_00
MVFAAPPSKAAPMATTRSHRLAAHLETRPASRDLLGSLWAMIFYWIEPGCLPLVAQVQRSWRVWLTPGSDEFSVLWPHHTAALKLALVDRCADPDAISRLCLGRPGWSPWVRALALSRELEVADAEVAVGARALLDQVHPDSRLSPGAERLLVRTAKRLVLWVGRCARVVWSQMSTTEIWPAHGCLNDRLVQCIIALMMPGELGRHAQSEATKTTTVYAASAYTKGGKKDKKHREPWNELEVPRYSQHQASALMISVGAVQAQLLMQKDLRCVDDLQTITSDAGQFKAGKMLTAVVEYVFAELLEVGGNLARDSKSEQVGAEHIEQAIADDDELRALIELLTDEAGLNQLPAPAPYGLVTKETLAEQAFIREVQERLSAIAGTVSVSSEARMLIRAAHGDDMDAIERTLRAADHLMHLQGKKRLELMHVVIVLELAGVGCSNWALTGQVDATQLQVAGPELLMQAVWRGNLENVRLGLGGATCTRNHAQLAVQTASLLGHADVLGTLLEHAGFAPNVLLEVTYLAAMQGHCSAVGYAMSKMKCATLKQFEKMIPKLKHFATEFHMSEVAWLLEHCSDRRRNPHANAWEYCTKPRHSN